MKLATLLLLLLVFACSCSKKEEPKKEDPAAKKEDPAAKKEEPKKEESAAKKEEPKKEEPKKEPKNEEPKKADGSGSGGKDDFNFSAMKTEDQIDYMKKTVVPAMKDILSKYDPKEFGNVNCKTCHGKDPKGTKYAMPSADLPKLDFAKLKAGKLSEKDMKMAKFMTDVVTPKMAELLHRPTYSEKTPDGFGCLACHQEKK